MGNDATPRDFKDRLADVTEAIENAPEEYADLDTILDEHYKTDEETTDDE